MSGLPCNSEHEQVNEHGWVGSMDLEKRDEMRLRTKLMLGLMTGRDARSEGAETT